MISICLLRIEEFYRQANKSTYIYIIIRFSLALVPLTKSFLSSSASRHRIVIGIGVIGEERIYYYSNNIILAPSTRASLKADQTLNFNQNYNRTSKYRPLSPNIVNPRRLITKNPLRYDTIGETISTEPALIGWERRPFLREGERRGERFNKGGKNPFVPVSLSISLSLSSSFLYSRII